MSHYLVDTNIWSEVTRSTPSPQVVDWLRKNERELFVSAITIGEIRFGIDRMPEGKRRQHLQDWLKELCRRMDGRILSFNTSVATVWGQLCAGCDAKGIKLPAIDSQIAATAKRHALVVATRNGGDFVNAGVKVCNPFETV